jgi:chromosome segregation protein
VQFSKLRISGFKSFVDPTELLIEPGMTGVVGPNGCGKSNLVEALRWVMGETSAKRMRGDDMDDVIFGGTATRPARNLCEVSLGVDNTTRTAPAGFNDFDDLDITRRLDRGRGSDYRINGKSVRARDVQLLFADNASGANSPALVSQGRVGALISAKPTDRRQLLEEAAGIGGLHARRHEAELRLRAAETNLTRLDDVLGAMDGQLGGLRKQARQASRYRNLQDHIRRAEAILLHQRWTQSESQLQRAHGGFAEAEGAVQGLMLAVTQATTRRLTLAEGLPPKRLAEASAAAALQRLVLAREQLDAEERRALEAAAGLQRRLAQIDSDLNRERALAADANGALSRLADERALLIEAQGEEALLSEAAESALVEAREALDDIDRLLSQAMEQVAAEEARRASLERQGRELETRVSTLRRRLDEQRAQHAALLQENSARADLDDAETAVAEAEERLELARQAAEAAESAKSAAEHRAEQIRQDAQVGLARAREAVQQAEGQRGRLKAEADALTKLLRSGRTDLFPPLIDTLTVRRGYEAALAAALGDDLTAPLDEAAPIHWRQLPDLSAVAPFPDGVLPLAPQVKAPPALARCLAHVGVVADAASGLAAAAYLLPGQVLVSRDGAAWRWDGLTVAAGAPTAAAQRLAQRNRLTELERELETADEALAAVREQLAEVQQQAEERQTAARHAVDAAAATDRQAREAVRQAFTGSTAAREQLSRLNQAAAAALSRLQALAESCDRLAADLEETQALWLESRETLAELPDPQAGRQRIAELRLTLAERRVVQSERQNDLNRLNRDAEGRRRRLAAIADEERSWSARTDGAAARLTELEERALEGRAELAALSERPLQIEEERSNLLAHISAAERNRRRAADELALLETEVSEIERVLKTAEAGLSDAREARARAEAAVTAALQAQESLRERVLEKLDCTPDQVLAVAAIDPADPFPEAGEVEKRLDRLLAERENMGPVNLLAEVEVRELEEQINVMRSEREDLTAAIARLRQGISALNREAREKLLASFEKVDGYFQDMFGKLFGGGKAHLKLTEAEDPLDAGLEIYASPPGKKLQILTLLSGGEQALTALALLFAVFLCNPSPICVLDEVDAPLDEANVGRFCDLVAEMARYGHTRFLIVTHHRLTMARMDRLYGVTMAERGISQLVSVDLTSVELLRGAA